MNIAVILCGGSGKRLGYNKNKVFVPIIGKEIILHTLEAFENNKEIDKIVLVLRKEDVNQMKKILSGHSFHKLHSVIEGGIERQQSVENAVNYLKSINVNEEDIVLIHNGANPLVTDYEIHQSIINTKKFAACAVGRAVKDTIKKVKDSYVIETPNRQELVAMQTPQSARFWLLCSAHEKAKAENFIGTDDASLIENLGHKVKIIEASNENIKITEKLDLHLAEIILLNRGYKR